MFGRRRPKLVLLRPPEPKPKAVSQSIAVIATRAPGEYILKIGEEYFIEANGHPRASITSGRVARILTVPDNDWEPRKPGTPYPTDNFEPDYHRVEAEEPDEEEWWANAPEEAFQEKALEWADPSNPGITTDGKYHLVGEHGEIGPEWDPSWDECDEDPLDPPSTQIRHGN